jgi:hypothetical protein
MMDAGMIFRSDFPELVVGGFLAFALEDLLTFPFLVGLGHFELFCDLHGGKNHPVALQGNLFAHVDRVGVGLADVQGNRYRPEGAVGKGKVIANAFPVGLGHKAIQGAEAADAHHDQVALGPGADLNLLQAFGLFLLGDQFASVQFAANQTFTTMGGDQFRHTGSPFVVISELFG